jgi:hypothetical protein
MTPGRDPPARSVIDSPTGTRVYTSLAAKKGTAYTTSVTDRVGKGNIKARSARDQERAMDTINKALSTYVRQEERNCERMSRDFEKYWREDERRDKESQRKEEQYQKKVERTETDHEKSFAEQRKVMYDKDGVRAVRYVFFFLSFRSSDPSLGSLPRIPPSDPSLGSLPRIPLSGPSFGSIPSRIPPPDPSASSSLHPSLPVIPSPLPLPLPFPSLLSRPHPPSPGPKNKNSKTKSAWPSRPPPTSPEKDRSTTGGS